MGFEPSQKQSARLATLMILDKVKQDLYVDDILYIYIYIYIYIYYGIRAKLKADHGFDLVRSHQDPITIVDYSYGILMRSDEIETMVGL